MARGRRKVRVYTSREGIERIVEDYFNEHRDEVIQDMIDRVNLQYGKDFKNLNELQEFDIHGTYYGGFGLDCGWVWIKPRNSDQAHEWFLDNDRIPDYASPRYPYNTQSTTLKHIMMEKAFRDLNLYGNYDIYTRLD